MHSEEDVHRPLVSRTNVFSGAGRWDGCCKSGATSIDVVIVSNSCVVMEIYAKPVPEATVVAMVVEVVVEPFSSIETEQKSQPTATEMTSPSDTGSLKS